MRPRADRAVRPYNRLSFTVGAGHRACPATAPALESSEGVSGMNSRGLIHVGTSGWHYDHWRERFYPDFLGKDQYLAYYAERFGTVEINNTFYQLPEEQTVRNWRDAVPAGFLFAVKASRYITHYRKLKDPEEPVARALGRVEELGGKLGPVLFQLPPNWRFNERRLRSFLEALPEGHRYAFEFRDASWFDDKAFRALEERGAALCIYDLGGQVSPEEVTADFVYVRFHGPAARYKGHYRTAELRRWAKAFSEWAGRGLAVYAYFNNDQEGHAVRDARELLSILAEGD